MILEEIKNIESSVADLRKFGLTLGTAFLILAGALLWKHKELSPYAACLGVPFLACGLLRPALLKPVQKAWMSAALVIGWVMTKIILAFLFYGVITPIALATRAAGKDFLSRKFPGEGGSYWAPHPPKDKDSYLNQF